MSEEEINKEELNKVVNKFLETAEKIFEAAKKMETSARKEIRKAFLMGILSTVLGIVVGGLLGYIAFHRPSPSPYLERSLQLPGRDISPFPNPFLPPPRWVVPGTPGHP